MLLQEEGADPAPQDDMHTYEQAHKPAHGHSTTHGNDRPIWPALARGWRRKCPRCGNGPLLRSYLKMRETCTVCRQDFTPARADDGPAYLTILIVGHLMAPLLHIVFVRFRPEPLILFTIFAVGCVALSLYLLPRLKGAIVGFQWARQMFGFGQNAKPSLDGRGAA